MQHISIYIWFGDACRPACLPACLPQGGDDESRSIWELNWLLDCSLSRIFLRRRRGRRRRTVYWTDPRSAILTLSLGGSRRLRQLDFSYSLLLAMDLSSEPFSLSTGCCCWYIFHIRRSKKTRRRRQRRRQQHIKGKKNAPPWCSSSSSSIGLTLCIDSLILSFFLSSFLLPFNIKVQ